MTKEEALKKIEELKKYVEGYDKHPEPCEGQVWVSRSGKLFMVIGVPHQHRLICIEKDTIGRYWHGEKLWGNQGPGYFTYVGKFEDLYQRKAQ